MVKHILSIPKAQNSIPSKKREGHGERFSHLKASKMEDRRSPFVCEVWLCLYAASLYFHFLSAKGHMLSLSRNLVHFNDSSNGLIFVFCTRKLYCWN